MISQGTLCDSHLAATRFANIFKMRPSTNSLPPTGQIESNYDEVTDSFDAMNLKPELLRGKSSR